MNCVHMVSRRSCTICNAKRQPCQHLRFEAIANVARIVEPQPTCFNVELHVRCADCGVRFEFVGVDFGYMQSRPMCSPDRFELRAPIRPNAHITSLMAGDPMTCWPGDRPPRTDGGQP